MYTYDIRQHLCFSERLPRRLRVDISGKIRRPFA